MDEVDDLNNVGNRVPGRPRKKIRVTMYLEPAVLEVFREQAVHRGAGYQTLINEALKYATNPDSAPLTVESLRRVLREEFARQFASRA